jgi:O-antigen/teichoic acid export membrane protein
VECDRYLFIPLGRHIPPESTKTARGDFDPRFFCKIGMNEPEMLESAALSAPREDESPAWRTDSLTDGVLIVLALMAVQRAVGFFRAILFCRWLDADQLGLWDMAFGFLMLAGPLVVLSLPGAFGRYAEYFRKRGRLRAFLLQTTAVCAVLALAGVGAIAWFRQDLSVLIFGAADREKLVLLLAVCLLAIVAYNYSLSLFTALRTVRLASAMEFVNGVSFAALGVILLMYWRCDASAVILAYGGASSLCVVGASCWYWKVWRSEFQGSNCPASLQDSGDTSESGIWRKLAPFAAWILLINLLTNLYGYTDRSLILHFAPGGECERLATVGQYHSARVVPLLLTSLATMLSVILLPHLSHDWESGRRDRVASRLNLFLKLSVLGTFAVGVAVLAVAPWLFEVAFRGKFAGGSAALPGMLAATVFFGAAVIAQQYIWCAERAGLIGLALAAGLAVNVSINLLLLPTLGLTSAVLAAVSANAVMLLSNIYFARRLGFQMQRGAWILIAAAASLALGPWFAVGVLAAICPMAIRGKIIFTAADKKFIAEKWDGYRDRMKSYYLSLSRRRAKAGKKP